MNTKGCELEDCFRTVGDSGEYCPGHEAEIEDGMNEWELSKFHNPGYSPAERYEDLEV